MIFIPLIAILIILLIYYAQKAKKRGLDLEIKEEELQKEKRERSRIETQLEKEIFINTCTISKMNETLTQEISKREELETHLKNRLKQQAAVAQLGHQALVNQNISELMDHAVALLSETLEVEYAKILEISRDGESLVLRAGVGWKEGLVGQATVKTAQNSQAGYSLSVKEPVIVENLATETRFTGPTLLLNHNVMSGMSVIIGDKNRPFGVLGVHSQAKRQFNTHDINFLQAVSNILGAAIERSTTETALKVSEEKFRRAVFEAPFPIIIHAEDGEVVQINQVWTDLTGYTQEDIPTVEEWTQLAYGERKQSVKAVIDQLYLLDQRIENGEFTITTKTGATCVWDFSSAPLGKLPDGRRLVISMAKDVTLRKQLELELEDKVKRLEIQHQIYQGIIQFQQPIDIALEAITSLKEVLKVDRVTIVILDTEQQKGKIWMNQDSSESGFELALKQLQPIIEPLEQEKNYILGDKSVFSELIPETLTEEIEGFICFPLRGKTELMGILQLWLDNPENLTTEPQYSLLSEISQQLAIALRQRLLYEENQKYTTRLEQLVEERTAKLKQSNEQLEAFTYSISHDLRAPLRAIQGFATALLEDYSENLNFTGKDYAQRLVEAGKRMDLLIQDLLTYSRLTQAELRFKKVNLSSILQQSISQLQKEIEASKAQIIVEEPLLTMYGNSTVLTQVITNLLANAIKFVAPEVKPIVRIWTEERGDKIRLWIEDNGIGISAQHQARIFQIFERLHGLETYPGTGIGLAIVQKGMERNGGSCGLESNLGQGSRFWIEAPQLM